MFYTVFYKDECSWHPFNTLEDAMEFVAKHPNPEDFKIVPTSGAV